MVVERLPGTGALKRLVIRTAYVADGGNNEIRRITPAGVVTTLAGSTSPGHADGTGTAASFYRSAGPAFDGAGNLYVTDSNNNELREISPAGVVTTVAGSLTAGNASGIGITATFSQPLGSAIDADDNLYIAEIGGNDIRKLTPN